MIWKPYGLPEIIDPQGSAYHQGTIQPASNVSDKIIVQPAITGAFFTKQANPNQPITTDEILAEARACVLEGASAIHLHVRGENGYKRSTSTASRRSSIRCARSFPTCRSTGVS
jgi:3-keto-5-aminohexanoate cleavage enzyme